MTRRSAHRPAGAAPASRAFLTLALVLAFAPALAAQRVDVAALDAYVASAQKA